MYYNFSRLFNQSIPNELDSLTELIDDIYDNLSARDIKLRWTTSKDFGEYGFYIDSANKTKNLFCGMWYELWETKGLPLCICLDWKKEVSNSIKDKFKAIAEGQNQSFLEFNEYPVIVFEKAFAEGLTDCTEIANLFIKLTEALNFGLAIGRI